MDYNRALNSVLIGWVLTLTAIVLNVLTWWRGFADQSGPAAFGILLGVLTLACAYFGEGMIVSAVRDQRLNRFRVGQSLHIVAICLCALSYLVWLFTIL